MIYLGFSKAFDSVPHSTCRFNSDAKNPGISGAILKWIGDFLADSSQRVVLSRSRSSWSAVYRGVSQGSVLGPLPFVYYVNDLPEGVLSDIDMYADDTKTSKIITATDDCTVLQEDLNCLMNLSNTWRLPFNFDKCEVMHIGKRTTSQCVSSNT